MQQRHQFFFRLQGIQRKVIVSQQNSKNIRKFFSRFIAH